MIVTVSTVFGQRLDVSGRYRLVHRTTWKNKTRADAMNCEGNTTKPNEDTIEQAKIMEELATKSLGGDASASAKFSEEACAVLNSPTSYRTDLYWDLATRAKSDPRLPNIDLDDITSHRKPKIVIQDKHRSIEFVKDN